MFQRAKIIDSLFEISDVKSEMAYNLACKLNEHDEYKLTTYVFGSLIGKPENSTSVSNNPSKSFVFMEWDYDADCRNIAEILFALGFDVDTNSRAVSHIAFDSYVGQEEIFFKAIAPCVSPGSYVVWRDETNTEWRWNFDGIDMKISYAD